MIMASEHKRQKGFQRNLSLEELLTDVNSLLKSAEKVVTDEIGEPQFPVVLVVGAPRCGSTIMMQWLAKLGSFAYPTNLLSRFYAAPTIGAKIQLLLTDPRYNFNGEILDFSGDFNFESNLGKTQGALAPNEFWYFWRRFVPNVEPCYLDEAMLRKIDALGLKRAIAGIQSVLQKPLVMKGHILEFNIPFLAKILETAVFVHIKTTPPI